MLNNKQIAGKFDLLAKLMELHDENPFKIKSYANAYLSLRKLEGDLGAMPKAELSAIKGVGTAIAEKILELSATGKMKALEEMQNKTPIGIQEMLTIKGLGPKKVKQIWKEMDILSVGELLYACNENRLVAYSGFGLKVQADIKEKLEYFQASQGKYLYAHVHQIAEKCLSELQLKCPETSLALCGEIVRCMPEVKGIEILSSGPIDLNTFDESLLEKVDESWYYKSFPLFIYEVSKAEFDKELFKRSGSETFLSAFTEDDLTHGDANSIFAHKGISFVPAEYRESPDVLNLYKTNAPKLIEVQEIKGIVHNHSTYSDGLHSLAEMADYVHTSGHDYFVISDHSKSAGYAGGLNEERVLMQWREIDALNAKYSDGFKIFKSIESDILVDGSLDYSEEILAQFDLIIASVHSVLNMDEEKATQRLIKAVENPYTNILGHPTGRLLLARPGYPVDYKKVIDACAANGVAMELNANPQRLDMDWTWIPYAMDKGVKIAINPDAHSKESIHYIKYGVTVARKGGLTADFCLNTLSASEFSDWCKNKK